MEDKIIQSQGRPRFCRINKLPTFNRESRSKKAANFSGKRLLVLGQRERENRFAAKLGEAPAMSLQTNLQSRFSKSKIEILQINLGKVCNLTCEHCHVEAGPNRKEVMSEELCHTLLERGKELGVHTVDMTGGSPEMHPGFQTLVRDFRKLGCKVMVRSNLTILLEPGYETLINFFAKHQVHVVASLPCYTKENVDRQRGQGVFEGSIEALRELQKLGYGRTNSELVLDLVYNPGGPFLPGDQHALEQAYKKELRENFGIEFHSLYVITNLPIGRFYSDLKKVGTEEKYQALLEDHFNPATVPLLMCKNTLSVSWDGWLYDCDFNQMIELPLVRKGKALHICDPELLSLIDNGEIQTGNHCFGCTAGSGSSCGGSLLP